MDPLQALSQNPCEMCWWAVSYLINLWHWSHWWRVGAKSCHSLHPKISLWCPYKHLVKKCRNIAPCITIHIIVTCTDKCCTNKDESMLSKTVIVLINYLVQYYNLISKGWVFRQLFNTCLNAIECNIFSTHTQMLYDPKLLCKREDCFTLSQFAQETL